MILLDTHALIWLSEADKRLGRRARAAADVALAAGKLAVSAISFWEAGLLSGNQRLRLSSPVKAWRDMLIDAGLTELPLDGHVAMRALDLDRLSPDPADRFIVATAIVFEATLLTADTSLLQWPGALQRQDAGI
ncbi:MAG: type II toxin-antitoxin system VapC family toxin [Burkholderiales bacterium]